MKQEGYNPLLEFYLKKRPKGTSTNPQETKKVKKKKELHISF
jgi:hypothetical protein